MVYITWMYTSPLMTDTMSKKGPRGRPPGGNHPPFFVLSLMNRIDKLFLKYYEKCDRDCVENIRNEIFDRRNNLSKRKILYRKYSSVIDRLQKIFQKIVVERNNIAQEEGFPDYFCYMNNWTGLSSRNFIVFEKSYLKISKKISSFFLAAQPPDWHKTIFNNLDLSAFFYDKSVDIPKDVFLAFREYGLSKNHTNRILLLKRDYRYYKTEYDRKSKLVRIYYDKDGGIDSAVLFAHELGHAITYLNLIDRNKDPDEKKWIWHELRAIKAELNYEKSLPELAQKAVRDRVLYHFVKTLFEKSIYTNSDQDFSEIYAWAHNQVYPGKQVSNPFYVLDTSYIEDPCYSSLYSVIYSKLLTA